MVGVLLVAALLIGQAPVGKSPPPCGKNASLPPNYVKVCGDATPEKIPEWHAWGNAMENLHRGSSLGVPTVLIPHFAEADRRRLFAAGAEYLKQQDACKARIEKEVGPLLDGKPVTADLFRDTKLVERIQAMEQAIYVECRQETLDLRTALIGDLSAEAATALIGFVEHSKSGLSYVTHKDAVAAFRQPQ